jgi:imidazolonepropionase-like amidohydrolase
MNRVRFLPAPSSSRAFAFLATLAMAGGTTGASAASFVLDNVVVHPVSSPGSFTGSVWVEGDRIAGIGVRVDAPAGVTRIDARGGHLYPGLIHPWGTLGLVEIGSVRGTVDTREVGEDNANLRAETAFNGDTFAIPPAVRGGVLTVHIAAEGGAFNGTSAVMKLDGWNWRDMTLQAPAGFVMTWPNMAKPRFGPGARASQEDFERERDAALRELDEIWDSASAYATARRAQDAGSGPRVELDPPFEAFRTWFDAQTRRPLFVRANDRAQILSALDWLAKRKIEGAVLVAGPDVAGVADRVARAKVPVILNGVIALPGRAADPYDAAYTAASRLAAAGVRFAIGDGDDPSNTRNLPFHAAMAVSFGLDPAIALRSITLSTAEILGVGDRLGSLERGKLATFFLSSGDPLDIRSHVERAWISGNEFDLSKDRQQQLYERYDGRPSPAGSTDGRPMPAGSADGRPTPSSTEGAIASMSARDPHSASKPDEVGLKHLDLALKVDFDRKRLQGTATWTLDRHTSATEVIFDVRSIDVARVTLDGGDEPVAFRLGDEKPFLGRSLTVPIGTATRTVRITYSTEPDAAALQWLTPAQTAGGKRPFLFTQSQAILARTWIPCQDSPGVRFTYAATIEAPTDLLAVMSAANPTVRSSDGRYSFRMEQPIPSYLMALAVGDLAFKPLGARSGVYAEPSVVDAAAYEFADTETLIAAAEALYGPYRWGRYDLLVLPPSFPFGGMENPRLTFATPTVIAGDRSLVSLVAHELAHSWSGNLVTNATWNDFWLNEGFTVYFEQRILEAVFGRELAEMEAGLELKGLRDSVADMGATNADTRLKLDLAGRDPDEGMNDIAYQKGRFFLRAVEASVGRARFDAFLRAYFDRFAFGTMTTDRFVAYLKAELLVPAKSSFDPATWIDQPGLPAIADPQSDAFARVDRELERLARGTAPAALATQGWVTQQWMRFLRGLPETTTTAELARLDATFHFNDSGNSEVQTAWFLRAIAAHHTAAYGKLEQFLVKVGRRKFLRPLYAELAKTAEGRAFARKVYAKARPGYHSVSQGAIDAILGAPPA